MDAPVARRRPGDLLEARSGADDRGPSSGARRSRLSARLRRVRPSVGAKSRLLVDHRAPVAHDPAHFQARLVLDLVGVVDRRNDGALATRPEVRHLQVRIAPRGCALSDRPLSATRRLRDGWRHRGPGRTSRGLFPCLGSGPLGGIRTPDLLIRSSFPTRSAGQPERRSGPFHPSVPLQSTGSGVRHGVCHVAPTRPAYEYVLNV